MVCPKRPHSWWMDRGGWGLEHMKTSLLWTGIKYLWAVGTTKWSQLHWSHSPWGVGLSFTQAETMRIRAGTHVYHPRT